MKNQTQNGSESVKDRITLTAAQIEQMVKRDIQSALLLLQAIHDDVDVCRAVATFLHGKYMNDLHTKELANQSKVEV